MASRSKVRVGIIGSQFEADIHAASFQIMPDEAEVVAVEGIKLIVRRITKGEE